MSLRAFRCPQKPLALQGVKAAAAAGGIVCKHSNTALSNPPCVCPNAAFR